MSKVVRSWRLWAPILAITVVLVSVSVLAASGSGWSLTGDSGTSPPMNFLGTTDNAAFEIWVNNQPALRIEPDATSPNLIGGGPGNAVTVGVHGATISGGRGNEVTDSFGTVGGGYGNAASGPSSTVGGGDENVASGSHATAGGGARNTAGGQFATVGGGAGNAASGDHATVGGGSLNAADGEEATVGGGTENTASFYLATVGGGYSNIASGQTSTVSGGSNNEASNIGATVCGGSNNTASGASSTVGGGGMNFAAGQFSFVAGFMAFNTEPTHVGVFLFADSVGIGFPSIAANEFAVRASGGYRLYSDVYSNVGVGLAPGATSWGAISDRNVKANFAEVDTVQLLDVLDKMPVLTWNLQAQPDEVRHIGTMAQDFNTSFAYLFGEVESPVHINMMDAIGVSLAASQGLYTLVQGQAGQIAELSAESVEQAMEIQELRAELLALRQLVEEGAARP